MNRRILLTGLALSLIVGRFYAAAQEADATRTATTDPAQLYAEEGYRLVWSDEFDRDGRPDPANWTFERGLVRNEEAHSKSITSASTRSRNNSP